MAPIWRRWRSRIFDIHDAGASKLIAAKFAPRLFICKTDFFYKLIDYGNKYVGSGSPRIPRRREDLEL